MNKTCPFCHRRITRKMRHVFIEGQRYHKNCAENLERVEALRVFKPY